MDIEFLDLLIWVSLFWLGFSLGKKSGGGAPIEPLDPARLSSDALARIDALIARGEKLEAIRVARQDAGCGLAEAKRFVDLRARALRPGDPIER
ncbi:hypothetical protein [Sphingomicrobium nitratireducens]|uniref:hypothetical protein n=1 Tax=Sphingomicrobium nitratireducens TaxID=2964666 RepID=UPI00223F2E40|nr:hypothetical protein [Sphingomicrobium nitratireducens]